MYDYRIDPKTDEWSPCPPPMHGPTSGPYPYPYSSLSCRDTWNTLLAPYVHVPNEPFHSICVATADSVRHGWGSGSNL